MVANLENLYFALILECTKYFNAEEIHLIKKAYLVASELHKNQRRKSGELYITHPLHVAYYLLVEMRLHDASSIAAALLHDTIEDTDITEELLEREFTKDIAFLVVGVTKIKDMHYTDKTLEEQKNTCLLLRHLMKDYRVILIKLADRLHNMRTLEYKSPQKQVKISAETNQIFVPLAKRSGTYPVKEELADLSFSYLSPNSFNEMRELAENYKLENLSAIEEIFTNVKSLLNDRNISSNIHIKLKSAHRLYEELEQRKKLSNIDSLITYQVVVQNLEQCYLTLMLIHNNYKTKPGFFKDYISTPKPNHYKAIHTNVLGPTKPSIQFQICTSSMNELNTYGLAALKDIYPNKDTKEIQKELLKTDSFISTLGAIGNLYRQDSKFLTQVEREVFSHQLKVYSKDGDIYYLPAGATVIDFAYLIHSEIGNTAINALITDAVEHKTTETWLGDNLHDGDIIEIICNPSQELPDKVVRSFATTSFAKREIKKAVTRSLKKT